MTYNLNTADALDVQIAGLQGNTTALNTVLGGFERSRTVAIAEVLSGILAFGRHHYSLPDQTALWRAFAAHQIKPHEENANRWLPMIYLTCGHYDPTVRVDFGKRKNLRKWHRDPSKRRYASALRHLDENGVRPSEVVKYVEGFTFKTDDGKVVTGLDALQRADRQKHGVRRGQLTDAQLQKVKSMSALAEVKIDASGVEGPGFIKAYGFWADGVFRLYGFEEGSGAGAQRLAIRASKDNAALVDDEAEEVARFSERNLRQTQEVRAGISA